MTRERRRRELQDWIHRALKAEFRPCLTPSAQCAERAIRAHSVPNRSVLGLLEENGHVVSPRIHASSRGVAPSLDHVGRNQATTFTGLCSAHDQQLFGDVDRLPLDLHDPRVLFLLAYRAVLREYYVLLWGAVRNQLGFQKKVELGLTRGDAFTPDGLRALGFIENAFEFHEYKLPLDEALEAGRFDELCHTVLTFPGHEPTVAVSSCLMLVELSLARDPAERLILTVFPDGSATNVIVSSTSRDRLYVTAHLSPVIEANEAYQKYFFSKLILGACENFVLSPRFYDKLAPERQEAITCFYRSTLSTDLPDVEDPRLLLF